MKPLKEDEDAMVYAPNSGNEIQPPISNFGKYISETIMSKLSQVGPNTFEMYCSFSFNSLFKTIGTIFSLEIFA
jgi:hypothetical protein